MKKMIFGMMLPLLLVTCSDQNSSGRLTLCKEVGRFCSEKGNKIIECRINQGILEEQEIPCKEEEICWEGVCFEDRCPNSCIKGSDRCLDKTTPLICQEQNGCFQYKQLSCPENQVCSEGRCYTTDCKDLCVKGTRECVDDQRVQECGNTDQDICTEWFVKICSKNQVCISGHCVKKPECSEPCAPNNECVFEDGETFCRCKKNFVDTNHDPSDGCECEYSNSTIEICDGIDNDCDGIIDNGGDRLCMNHLLHASAICDTYNQKMCLIESCDEGWIDLNNDPKDGCEHPKDKE